MYEIVDIAQLESVAGGFETDILQIYKDVTCCLRIGGFTLVGTIIPATIVFGITESVLLLAMTGLGMFPVVASTVYNNRELMWHCRNG